MLDLRPYVEQYGYLAVFGAVMLEDFGLPVPGETALIVGAVFASQGQLNIVLVLFLGWLGAVIGDNIGYAIGRFGGRKLVIRYGKFVLIRGKRLERAESFFSEYGAVVVVVARFIEILRQLNGLVAGTMRMRWWRFLLFNMIGAALWIGLWGTIFYFLGEDLGNIISRYPTDIAVVGVGVAVIAIALYWSLRWRGKERQGEKGGGDD